VSDNLTRPERPADLDRSSVARYIQLATLFRHRIAAGQWPIGSQIPTLKDLVSECGVARATVRQAISVLASEGLVSRFRAKGTFVRDAPSQFHIELTTDWQGLLNPRAGAIINILEDEADVAPPKMRHDIGNPAAKYRRVKRLHLHAGRPVLVADLYVDASVAYRLDQDVYRTTTAMRLASALDGVQIVDAHQTLTIGAADIELARLLDLPLNAPICHVDRSAVDQHGRLIVISKGVYRGDVVRLDLKLR